MKRIGLTNDLCRQYGITMDDLSGNEEKVIKKIINKKCDRDDQLKAKLAQMLSTGKKASLEKFVAIQENQLVNFLKKEMNVWTIHCQLLELIPFIINYY